MASTAFLVFLGTWMGCDLLSGEDQHFEEGEVVPGTARPIIGYRSHSFYPSYSPDGEDLLVTDGDSGPGAYLYIVTIATGNRRLLTEGHIGDWSRVGDWIVFQCGSQICKIKGDGSERTVLTDNRGSFTPTWSPDGLRIAYVRRPKDESVQGGVWIMNADGSGHEYITTHASQPVWHPDGTRLAVAVNSDPAGGCELELMDLTGESTPSILVDSDNCSQRYLRFDPSGSRLSYGDEDGVWILNTSTGSRRKVLPFDLPPIGVGGRDPFLASHATWSPDGKSIAYEHYAVTKYEPRKYEDDYYEGIHSIHVVDVDAAIARADL